MSVPSQIEFVWEEVPSDVERDAGVLDVADVRLLRHVLPVSLLILKQKPTALQS